MSHKKNVIRTLSIPPMCEIWTNYEVGEPLKPRCICPYDAEKINKKMFDLCVYHCYVHFMGAVEHWWRDDKNSSAYIFE